MMPRSFCSTLVCKGRNEVGGSRLSEASRFLESCKQEGCSRMGGEMADAMLPRSPAATSLLLYAGSLWEPVPCTMREQAWLGFKKEGYLTRDGKRGSQQRSGKACIFHWGGEGI